MTFLKAIFPLGSTPYATNPTRADLARLALAALTSPAVIALAIALCTSGAAWANGQGEVGVVVAYLLHGAVGFLVQRYSGPDAPPR